MTRGNQAAQCLYQDAGFVSYGIEPAAIKVNNQFLDRTFQYVEQSMAQWVMSQGALPVLIPSADGDTARGEVHFDDYARWLDAPVLHGGADVWLGSCGETPLQARWSGDRFRDEYEKARVKAFVAVVQWHPEFHRPELVTLDDTPLLQDFLAAAQAAKVAMDP